MGAVFAAKAQLEEVYAAYAEPDADFDALAAEQARLEAVIATAGTDSEHQLEIAADALRLPPWDAIIGVLSGGEKRRVALCRLLLSKPDMLLLDEPTNHLDAESVAWLERFLKEYPGTVVAVTHDRYFLDNVAGWILELDRGAGIPWEGNYSSWLGQKRQRLAAEEKQASARQAKGKARLAAYERMLAEETERLPETVEIYVPPGPRLGKVAIEAEGLRKAYGENVLFDDLSFKLPPGAGKTTLFRIIVGQEKADAGALRVGETVKFGYVD